MHYQSLPFYAHAQHLRDVMVTPLSLEWNEIKELLGELRLNGV